MKPRRLRQGIALYLRVSSDDKQNPDSSFEYQRQRIQACIAQSQNDLPTIVEYSDILSGKNNRRPGYQRMLAEARDSQFSHLAVYSIDRLGRTTEETLSTVQELIRLGIEIVVADSPNMEISSPSGSLLLGIRAVIAQYEVDMFSQRVKDTKRAILLSGGWPAVLPDGYIRRREQQVRGRKRSTIEMDPERVQVWREAWDLLLAENHTLQKICQELHNRGYTRKSGKPWAWIEEKTGDQRYAISQLSHSFHLPFYAGWVVSPTYGIQRGEVRGQWPPLVSDAEFDEGQAILRRHDENKVRKKRHTYMLTGLLYMRVEV